MLRGWRFFKISNVTEAVTRLWVSTIEHLVVLEKDDGPNPRQHDKWKLRL